MAAGNAVTFVAQRAEGGSRLLRRVPVARWLALDTTFGRDGIAIHAVAAGTRSDSARALVLQADERVSTVRAILAGEVSGSNYDFGLLRLWL